MSPRAPPPRLQHPPHVCLSSPKVNRKSALRSTVNRPSRGTPFLFATRTRVARVVPVGRGIKTLSQGCARTLKLTFPFVRSYSGGGCNPPLAGTIGLISLCKFAKRPTRLAGGARAKGRPALSRLHNSRVRLDPLDSLVSDVRKDRTRDSEMVAARKSLAQTRPRRRIVNKRALKRAPSCLISKFAIEGFCGGRTGGRTAA